MYSVYKLNKNNYLYPNIQPFLVVGFICDLNLFILYSSLIFFFSDVLINNAGVLQKQSVRNFDPNDYERIMNINVLAPMMLSK